MADVRVIPRTSSVTFETDRPGCNANVTYSRIPGSTEIFGFPVHFVIAAKTGKLKCKALNTYT